MTDAAPAGRRRRLVPALILAVTFALGIVAGLGLAPLVRPPPSLVPPSLAPLQLRPEQRARIDAIIARHGPEVDAALGDALPRLREVQERVAGEIEAELDARQREVFRRLRASRPGAPIR